MKNKAALLLLIGLVCAPFVYAQDQEPQAPAATASPEGRTKTKKTKSGDDFVTLNFTNIDISALVKVMSELTRRNFILDERVAGKVTLMTPTKISPDEAYQVFLSALEIKGFTAVEDGKVIRIIPAATARQSGLKVLQDGEMRGEGFVTKLIRMNFVNPQEIVRTITPLVTKDGSLIAYPTTNSVIITDSVSNIRKIESLIHAMDVAAPEGKGKINVYYLRNASSEDIAKLMQALVSRLPVPPAGGAAAPAGPSTILEGSRHHHVGQGDQFAHHRRLARRFRDHEGRDPETRHQAPPGLRRGRYYRNELVEVARTRVRVPGAGKNEQPGRKCHISTALWAAPTSAT